MYTKFYGLSHRPFDLNPDGGLVFLSESHREAVATLRYGVIADKGFVLLTGGVGTGKTTLLNAMLATLKGKVKVCLINNPTLEKSDFFYFLAHKLGIDFDGNKAAFILQLTSLLERYAEGGGKILLIIDEAQIFPIELLEEVRLLSNLSGEQNGLSIFLVGQPELEEKLAAPRLLPLRQRIGIRHHIEPLSLDDTGQYIIFRLQRAGAVRPNLFTPDALAAIHQGSHGNPRLVNIICDHALIHGFSNDLRQIDRKTVEDSLADIRLGGEKGLQISEHVIGTRGAGDIEIKEEPHPVNPAGPESSNGEEDRPESGSMWKALGFAALLLGMAAALYYALTTLDLLQG